MKSWRIYFFVFIPLWVTGMVAAHYYGLKPVLLVGGVLVISILLYERLVKRRSWRAILWGTSGPPE